MKKTGKILLLIASLWPFIYTVIFFVIVFSAISSMPLRGRPDVGAFEGTFEYIALLHVLTILDVLGLTIFYMINVFRNDRVIQEKKALWAVVLFLGNVIAFPIYWYFYIWPEKDVLPRAAVERQSLYYTDPARWVDNATMNGGQKESTAPPDPPDWH